MKFTFPTIITIFFLLIFTSAAYVYYVRSENGPIRNSLDSNATTTASYECNQDGKICADRSIVGRTGPRCEFSECPGVFPVSTTTPHATAILYGQVTISPICPVERNPPEPSCAPRGYVTEVSALDLKTGRDVGATTKTTSNGTFIMDLFPGSYSIRAKSGAVYPKCQDVTVTVYANASSSVSLSCDSGIR